MTNSFIFGMACIFAFSGILMAGLQWMVLSDKYKQYRIRTPESYRIPMSKKIQSMAFNSAFSISIFVIALGFFHTSLVSNRESSWVLIFGEVLASLLIYDFFYYFMHRILHNPKLMKFVHGVHHKARFPTTIESLYLHPAENLAGLGLLLCSTAFVGPVSSTAFLLIIFIHSSANILVHSNLILPHPIFKLFNSWALRHDYHHGKHLNKNFASIFPFWDQMFGTYK